MELLPLVFLGAMRFVNSDDHSRSLIPLPDASLALTRPEGGRVLSEMLSDTLALARGEPLRKIGEYEWCEPDYRQILLWADALSLEPEEVIRRLLDTENLTQEIINWAEAFDLEPEEEVRRMLDSANLTRLDRDGFELWAPTTFRDGRIKTLHWDFGLLPLAAFQWVEGLKIEYLRFLRGWPASPANPPLNLSLPELRALHYGGFEIDKLDISRVPTLTELDCGNNALTALDLSQVPALEKLAFHWNQFAEFAPSQTPMLAELNCRYNQLTRLDLSRVPMLTELACDTNRLTELHFTFLPLLNKLSCGFNKLTSLDLSGVPLLTELDCRDNQLTEIDLSGVPMLTELGCGSNQLTTLDLSKVQMLTELLCYDNPVTELELSNVPMLRRLYTGNRIDILDIRPLHHLEWLKYDSSRTRLIQRPDQHFQ